MTEDEISQISIIVARSIYSSIMEEINDMCEEQYIQEVPDARILNWFAEKLVDGTYVPSAELIQKYLNCPQMIDIEMPIKESHAAGIDIPFTDIILVE